MKEKTSLGILDKKSVIEFVINYGDIDSFNVVYYANYLRFAEAGRNDFVRNVIGKNLSELENSGWIFPVVNVNIDYKSPARLDDKISVVTKLSSIGQSSLKFDQKIFRLIKKKDKEGQKILCSQMSVVCACVDKNMNKQMIPKLIREM